MFVSPIEGQGDQFQENLNVASETLPTKMNLDQYTKAAIKGIELVITDVSEVKQTKTTIGKNNLEAMKIEYSGRQGTINAEFVQYIVLKDNSAYVITYTFQPTKGGTFTSEVNNMVGSFEFID